MRCDPMVAILADYSRPGLAIVPHGQGFPDPATWPDDITIKLERAFIDFELPMSVLILVRALVLASLTTQAVTIPEIVAQTDLPERAVRDAIKRDGGLFLHFWP